MATLHYPCFEIAARIWLSFYFSQRSGPKLPLKMSKSGQRHSDNTRGIGNCTESRCFVVLVVQVGRGGGPLTSRTDTKNPRSLMALREASEQSEGRQKQRASKLKQCDYQLRRNCT